MVDQLLQENPDALEPPPRRRGPRVLLLAGLPLLLVGAGAGAYFGGALDGWLLPRAPGGEATAAGAAAEPRAAVFFDLPEQLVNLSASGRRASYLKLQVSLEIGRREDAATLQQLMPRIIDTFQVYLRELRLEELQGSAGLHRLREELLVRVNKVVEPVPVHDVLFREMLVQ